MGAGLCCGVLFLLCFLLVLACSFMWLLLFTTSHDYTQNRWGRPNLLLPLLG